MFQVATRDDPKTTDIFFNPPYTGGNFGGYDEDVVYQLDSSLSVQWATSHGDYDILLYQEWLNGGGADIGPIVYSARSEPKPQYQLQDFDWTVQTYDFKIVRSPIFFFWAKSGDTSLFTSHYFNITADPSPTSTLKAQVPSSTDVHPSSTAALSSISSLLAGSGTQTSTPGTTSSPTGASTSTLAMSDGAKAGLGIGVGVAALLILGLCFFFGYRFAKRRRLEDGTSHAHASEGHEDNKNRLQSIRSDKKGPPSYSKSQGLYELAGPEPKELSARRTIMELP